MVFQEILFNYNYTNVKIVLIFEIFDLVSGFIVAHNSSYKTFKNVNTKTLCTTSLYLTS